MNKNIVTSIALAVLFLISAAGVVEGATNIINNPGFESGKTSWIFYTSGTGTFTAIPPGFEGNNSAKLVLNSPGTNIQLYQTGIKLEPNTNYRLSFAAYSTSGHDVTVNLFKHVSPYTNYGLSNTFDLGTSWQVFNYEFTTKGFTNNVSDGRFQFWLAPFAAAGDIYYIDAIIVEKIGDDTAPPIVTGNTPTGTNVPVTTQITVTFNESMNQSSAQTAFSTLPATTGSFGWSGNMMIYTPSSNLAYNTTYTVTVGTGAKDIAGNNLQAPYSWQFTTINASTLDERVASLETRVAALEKLLSNVTRNEEGDIYIDGANLHIRDGSGDTEGPVNGLGNLIIGYNELRSGCVYPETYCDNNRTGSHNLILGLGNNYMSYGGLVAGSMNEISGPLAAISGGGWNTASGESSSVSGGIGNNAMGEFSSVSGGAFNTASGEKSSVSGGQYNEATGSYSSVSGGENNTASGYMSSVSGGAYNTASGSQSSVSGGDYNTASSMDSAVSGGHGNTASDDLSSVSGGQGNIASGFLSSVSGGNNNIASGQFSWVGGGQGNTASGRLSSVSAGESNNASGQQSSVSGGYQRNAVGIYDWWGGGSFQDQ